MSGFLNDNKLTTLKKGQVFTARQYNEIVRLLQRTITGPNVHVTSKGWHIRPDNRGGTLSAEDPDQVGTRLELEPAQTDDWDQSEQGDFDGVIVTMQTRSAYDDTGDEKLYAYYRDFKYDINGRLMTISVETRVTIDTPSPCP